METQRCWNPWCGMQVVISGLILLMGIRSIEAAPQGSLVTFLPGFNGTFPSKHYTGYVNFEEKNLFYYFVTSERNPIKDPVVLWLNGGPGCSSFDGFVYEHGPFNFGEGQPKGSLPILHLNPYSWSKVSNIIYLDSPCGVGLSYSLNKTNYVTDDLKTAADTHTFLLKWFDLYPEFVENPFYISGESYARVYVPTLAVEVVKGIKADKKPIINFKGYLIGNGVTHSKFDGVTSLMSFGHGMGLISDDHFEAAEKDCKRNFEDPSTQCYQRVIKALQSLRGLNIYNILEPCYHDPEAVKKLESNISSTIPLSFQQLGVTERPLKVRKRMFGCGWPLWSLYGNGPLPSWSKLALEGSVPCVDDEIATAWLNDKDVRKAIHANPISDTGPWELCVDIDYNYNTGSMLPYHKNLTMQGYRALIYSGDHDMCVPFTGTQAWTGSLGYTKVEDWRPWLSSTQQVAGYIQRFNHNLTFLTIKGAGHTVPEYKPQESLDFYSRWLDGKSM